MRSGIFKIFRFDFVFLYCLIDKIAQDMNAGNTVFSQLISLILDYFYRLKVAKICSSPASLFPIHLND